MTGTTMEYYRGKAEAIKEAYELLQLIHTSDNVVESQLNVLAEHLRGMIERAENTINVSLNLMEAEELLRG